MGSDEQQQKQTAKKRMRSCLYESSESSEDESLEETDEIGEELENSEGTDDEMVD